jgi:hypothetical protein
MNPMIPLGVNPLNITGAMEQGREIGQKNALRAAMQQHGAAAMNGDQNALRAIAQYDIELGMRLMSGQQDMELARNADGRGERADARSERQLNSGLKVDQAQIERLHAEGKRAAEEHGLRMSAAQRSEELAQAAPQIEAMKFAYEAGPEEFERWASTANLPASMKGLTYDKAPYAIAAMGGALEGLAGGGELHNVPAGSTVLDSETRQPIFTAPKETPPITMGTPPPGYAVSYDDNSRPVSMAPIPNSPAALEAEAAAAARQTQAANRKRTGEIVIEDIGRAKAMVENAPWYNPATGAAASAFSSVGGTNAANTRELVSTIKANVGFDSLQKMRDASPTGAALGAISDTEMKLLTSVLGSLEQSQSEAQLLANLDRLNEVYNDIVNVGSYAKSKTVTEPNVTGDDIDSVLGRYQ